ncbi:MAG: hypothetical protein FWD74_10160 [Actinomycetia bacterium]|nr:hypothetical protein [Actinomycetes bacterium]
MGRMLCAVSFQRHGRLYYADPGALTLAVGDRVLYPTQDAPEVAEVVWPPSWTDEDIPALPLLAGIAGPQELARAAGSRRKRAQAQVAAHRLVREHGLPMKISGVDHLPELNHSIIYFTAPHRVDFRALVRDLSATLHGRVELRQLSPRDEARLIGGIGSCGRALCCASFLVDFEPVSVRMAKEQDLPLNPLRISGACGRLMCCLKFEHPLYQDFAARAPAEGAEVGTPDGPGAVIGRNVPTDTVLVRLAAEGRQVPCPLTALCASRAERDGQDQTNQQDQASD